MTTSITYDQLVQKLLDDGSAVSKSEAKRRVTLQEARKMLEGTFKTIEGHTVGYKIAEDGKSAKITVPAAAGLKADNIPEHLQPKRRGRPPGVKNKPKVK